MFCKIGLIIVCVSDPSGTGGPQLTPRNGPPGPHNGPPPSDIGPPPHHFPPKQDLPIIDESRIATNRPVIVAQIPPPPQRSSRAPGPAPGPSQGPLPGPKRNAPVRSQSMGVADTGRFYMKPGSGPVSGPPPRFRPPPPPDERRPMVTRRVPEYHDTSSDGEDGVMFDPIVPDYRSLDRRKTTNYANPHALNMNQKYKTLEPRSKSGGDAHSLERLTNGSRRVLPDVPSHSLPRQGKRAQSDSRSRDRAEEVTKRSQSHGDNANGDNGRRKLPQVPNRDLREPTPDYDSPPPSDNRLRRNSDSGLLDVIEERGDEGGGGVKRHASSVDKSQKRMYLNNSLDNSMESDESKGK